MQELKKAVHLQAHGRSHGVGEVVKREGGDKAFLSLKKKYHFICMN